MFNVWFRQKPQYKATSFGRWIHNHIHCLGHVLTCETHSFSPSRRCPNRTVIHVTGSLSLFSVKQDGEGWLICWCKCRSGGGQSIERRAYQDFVIVLLFVRSALCPASKTLQWKHPLSEHILNYIFWPYFFKLYQEIRL